MKLDLQNLTIQPNIGSDETVTVDSREQIANVIYQNNNGVAALLVAEKIYKSEGETEYDDREIEIIKNTVNRCCTPPVIRAFNLY